MKSNKINIKSLLVLGVSASLIFSSCNKELETINEIPVINPAPTGQTMYEYIHANSNYTVLDSLIDYCGIRSLLTSPGTKTLFAPDNLALNRAGNALSGGLLPVPVPNANIIGFFKANVPKAQLTSILTYHVKVGKLAAADFPTVFPNVPHQSSVMLDASRPFLRLNLFPSKRTGLNYINTYPISAPDLLNGKNGIVHGIPGVLLPAASMLGNIIDADPSLTYLKAALVRADSGQVGLNRLDSAARFPLANLTVFAPNNTAFITVLTGLVYQKMLTQGYTPGLATLGQAQGIVIAQGPGIFSNPAYNELLPNQLVRGIVAYHILGSRAFACNMGNAATTDTTRAATLVTGQIPYQPILKIQTTFSPQFLGTSMKIIGYGTFPPGGAAYSGAAANTTSIDKFAVNGVLHVIDKLLLPQ